MTKTSLNRNEPHVGSSLFMACCGAPSYRTRARETGSQALALKLERMPEAPESSYCVTTQGSSADEESSFRASEAGLS